MRTQVPSSWLLRRDGIWLFVEPPGAELPNQGWKIHISATPENCQEILKRTSAVCVQRQIPFKFLIDSHVVSLSISKGWSRKAGGKFITLYPSSERHFQETVGALYTVLDGFDGPYILSDKRYKDSHVLYYRYGAFRGHRAVTLWGTTEFMLRAPNGRLIPDIRVPFWNPPEWVTDPFHRDDLDSEEDSADLKDGRYRVERALAFSITGGVYAATDLDNGRTVVIKEARPCTAVRGGVSAIDRLKKEYRLLQKLRDTGVAPVPLDLFWDWEHLFLVEELVFGVDLALYLSPLNPTSKGYPLGQDKDFYVETLVDIWSNLAAAIETLHSRNIICGDLSVKNVFVNDVREVRLLDLEAAWEEGVDAPSPWLGTPGFAPISGVRGKSDDIYTLGAVMLATIHLINPIIRLEPSLKQTFVEEVGKEIGLPKQMRALTLACLSDNPQDRPSAFQIVEALRSIPKESESITAPMEDVSQPEISPILDSVLNYIRSNANLDRQDRLFPADPHVFATNPLSIAYGAIGVAYAIHRIAGEVPKPILSWILSQPIHPDRYPPGLYLGGAGIAWSLWEIGLEEIAVNVMRSFDDHPLLFAQPNVFYGAAGYGLSCLHFYLATGGQEWLDKAVCVGEWLLKAKEESKSGFFWRSDEGDVPLGYALGAAGIALYLLYLGIVSGNDQFVRVGKVALAHDLSHARELPGVGLSIPRTPESSVLSHYWWDGSAGVCAALIRFYTWTRDTDLLETFHRLIPDTFRRFATFPGLFRGLAGLGNVLLDAYDFIKEERYLQEAKRVASGILLHCIQRGDGIAFPGEQLLRLTTDFGTGSAGTALFLHRLVSCGRVCDFNFTLDRWNLIEKR